MRRLGIKFIDGNYVAFSCLKIDGVVERFVKPLFFAFL